MSLDKAIKSGKEKRKPYRGGKQVSWRCRNHGTCGLCEGNRRHKFRALPLEVVLKEAEGEDEPLKDEPTEGED
jgi:hypothetical protein